MATRPADRDQALIAAGLSVDDVARWVAATPGLVQFGYG